MPTHQFAPSNTPPLNPRVNDTYLDDGTNTGSGNPGWRYCVSIGPDVWADSGGGGGAPLASLGLGAGDYTYTQAVVPVEEVCGDGSFNGSLVGSGTAYFKAAVTNVFQTTGTTRVRLYDMGTAAGPPGTPRLVTELVFSAAGGPRMVEQALTVVAAAPGTNDILDSDRMYEVAIIQDVSTTGDVAYLGSAGLEVR